ncbi:MAG: oligosaccharide flippase family protein, partial [Deltaproteobacteria bacterium]|nr:oligosaccharide flippase family protein [Deltaproteobacteria bacterium]
EETAAAHFTLKVIFAAIWALMLVGGTCLFTIGPLRVALLFLTATSFCMQLVQTPRLILVRRVTHRRLAVVQITNTVFITLIPLGLAFRGVELWALLATNLIELLLTVFAFYIYHPVWIPRLTWSSDIVRYFLRFGSRNVWSILLLKALDRVDDLWTGYFLGKAELGLYSRAYRFATYPRQALAVPINSVASGVYAELKGDRLHLSQAFFRINATLVRTGFCFAGILMLVGPEFIGIVLGPKWLPMLNTFRLMLIFTLFDPIKTTVDRVFIAVGKPEILVKTKLIQLGVLIVGLFTLGAYFHIAGVAVAVNVMLVAGMVVLLWQAKAYVDYSALKLFAFPGVAFVTAAGTVYAVLHFAKVSEAWQVVTMKISIFLVVYFGVLIISECRQMKDMMALFIGILRPNNKRKIEGIH